MTIGPHSSCSCACHHMENGRCGLVACCSHSGRRWDRQRGRLLEFGECVLTSVLGEPPEPIRTPKVVVNIEVIDVEAPPRLTDLIRAVTHAYISWALSRAGYNKTRAATLLRASRVTIARSFYFSDKKTRPEDRVWWDTIAVMTTSKDGGVLATPNHPKCHP